MNDNLRRKRIEVGLRLRAARLVMGIATIQEAARSMRVPPSSLKAAESGARTITGDIFNAACKDYRIDENTLLHGQPYSERDRLILRLAAILRTPETGSLTKKQKGLLSARLVKLRQAAGFTHATTAARHFGWPRASYVAYEGRSEKMSTDRMVIFALAMTDDIESFFALDQPAGPAHSPESNEPNSTSNGESESGASWPKWLEPSASGHSITMRVLEVSYLMLHLSEAQLTVPRAMFHTLPQFNSRIYAIQRGRDEWRQLMLMEYPAGPIDVGRCYVYGEGRVRKARRDEILFADDPAGTGASPRSIVLGYRIGELGMSGPNH